MSSNYMFALRPRVQMQQPWDQEQAHAQRAYAPPKASVQAQGAVQAQAQAKALPRVVQFARSSEPIPNPGDRFSITRLINFKSPAGCRSCS
jgi:hypothetical protein